MEDKKIVISYDTLFELLRIERSRTELQELPVSYLDDIKEVINADIESLKLLKDEGEKQKKRIHISNMLKIVNEIYERREKKIVNLAVNKSKTKSAIVDISRILPHEREIFDSIVSILDDKREGLNKGLLSLGHSLKEKEITEQAEQQPASVSPHNQTEKENASFELAENERMPEKKESLNKDDALRIVRFLSPIPRFLGPELEEYGPFVEEDVANLPTKIVDILVSKNRAEEILMGK